MVEAGASQVSEAQVLEAIEFGHDCCRKIAGAIKQMVAPAARPSASTPRLRSTRTSTSWFRKAKPI